MNREEIIEQIQYHFRKINELFDKIDKTLEAADPEAFAIYKELIEKAYNK